MLVVGFGQPYIRVFSYLAANLLLFCEMAKGKNKKRLNITEENSNNNRPLYQFPPWKQFVSPVETNCFHGGNSGK